MILHNQRGITKLSAQMIIKLKKKKHTSKSPYKKWIVIYVWLMVEVLKNNNYNFPLEIMIYVLSEKPKPWPMTTWSG